MEEKSGSSGKVGTGLKGRKGSYKNVDEMIRGKKKRKKNTQRRGDLWQK